MDYLRIVGGQTLKGTIDAGGSKNSGLILMLCSILTDEPITLQRVPRLRDVDTMKNLLRGFGAEISESGKDTVAIHLNDIRSVEAEYDLVRTMRASITCLGPLLARAGKAKVSLPGGCAIGNRPVDIHLDGLQKMGVAIDLDKGYILAEAPNGLQGAEIALAFPSVGATENLLMAATLAKGTTKLTNCAREPEIVDVANLLKKMGANIEGAGSSTILVHGVDRLHGCDYRVMFDRIESATLLLAGPITGGSVRVDGCEPGAMQAILDAYQSSGINITSGLDWVEASAGLEYAGTNVVTEPFPGFPTDGQAQFMAFLSQIAAVSSIDERIFENRFMHVPELNRMGADIQIKGSKALINGKTNVFRGATVMATDLRASASLVLAGLSAKGETIVRRVYHLDRGYERIEEKLRTVGATIERLS